ncbi:hypothetical protein PMI01_01753 [Caulobacter sp. AP07]|uniref:hypothetical protein n=1 Tax=Caulobacter sp. AP07 TaxID=1144304 RepID=UPI000271E393|nr:hypothetical protein [Caulobacter sp. AP07]EJL34226.1 hypothetical protein PMI01_01753 [Caulobacter sp. AP07]
MIEAGESPVSIEDISAGLLNGAMIALLGCAFPGFLLWQALLHLEDLAGVMADPGGKALSSLGGISNGLMLVFFSLVMVRGGLKYIRKNLAFLRARKSQATPSGPPA